MMDGPMECHPRWVSTWSVTPALEAAPGNIVELTADIAEVILCERSRLNCR